MKIEIAFIGFLTLVTGIYAVPVHPPPKYQIMAPEKYHEIIIKSAYKNKIPVEYLDRLLKAESGYNSLAISYKNCRGIAQLNPLFYNDFVWFDNGGRNFDFFDPYEEIPVAAHYLARLKQQFGDFYHALIAYHEGSGKLKRGIIYDESRRYALKIVFGEGYKAK